MGLVIDSSVLIEAERAKRSVSDLLSSLSTDHSEKPFVISSITVMEPEHGWHRARSHELAVRCRIYPDEVFAIIPVAPFTNQMGVLAAGIDARL